MSGSEEGERLGKDQSMDKSGLRSGSVGDGAGGTMRDSDSDSQIHFMGFGAPGPLPITVIDGGGRGGWHINDEKELVIELGDEDGVQLQ